MKTKSFSKFQISIPTNYDTSDQNSILYRNYTENALNSSVPMSKIDNWVTDWLNEWNNLYGVQSNWFECKTVN